MFTICGHMTQILEDVPGIISLQIVPCNINFYIVEMLAEGVDALNLVKILTPRSPIKC